MASEKKRKQAEFDILSKIQSEPELPEFFSLKQLSQSDW